MLVWQSTPHSLFVLDKKRTGRGRSKRKKRYGGSVRASAYLRPPAGDGWRSLAAVRDGNAFPLGVTKPGEVPDTLAFSFRWRYLGGLPSSRQSVSKAQANLEGQTFRQAPRSFHQTGNRGARLAQGNDPACGGRRLSGLRRNRFRTAPVHKPTCAHAQVRRLAFFSFGPSTARFLFGKIEKKMGGGLPS